MVDYKENIRRYLVEVGRKMVEEKGQEFLTARKLSEMSGCSVGTIYNQFSAMDKLITEINIETLKSLYNLLLRVKTERSAYKNLNAYIDVFVGYDLSNPNLWLMLYNF